MPVRQGRPKDRRHGPTAQPEVNKHSGALLAPTDIPAKHEEVKEQFPKRGATKVLHIASTHLKINSEVFQGLLMKVLLVKEQQQLKNTPVKIPSCSLALFSLTELRIDRLTELVPLFFSYSKQTVDTYNARLLSVWSTWSQLGEKTVEAWVK